MNRTQLPDLPAEDYDLGLASGTPHARGTFYRHKPARYMAGRRFARIAGVVALLALALLLFSKWGCA